MSAQPPPRRPPAPEEAPTAVGAAPHAPRAPAYGTPAAPVYREPVPPGYGPPPGYEPLPPDDPRWWERGWWSEALAALAALVVGFLIGLLVGESSSSKTATTGASGPARTVTVKGPTHTTTVTHVVVHTHTVTAATPSESGGSEGSSGGAAGGGKTYTGSGSSRLGTITVSRQSTIHWRSGGGFSIKNSPEDEHSLGFNSSASSGESTVEPGTYHQVTVSAPGEWSMTISPG